MLTSQITYLSATRLYAEAGPPPAIVSVQNPARLSEISEPQPDVVLIRPEKKGVSEVEDVLLLVEVSDTTLAFDREVKLPRYAAAGIPKVWSVALTEDMIAVYRKPSALGYEERRRGRRGDALGIEALPQAGRVLVEEMLGS